MLCPGRRKQGSHLKLVVLQKPWLLAVMCFGPTQNVMSSDKKIPATSLSTPSKTDVQQLLAKISPVVIHNALRSFREQQPMTTLLVMNWSSPVVLLCRILAPEQGTVKLSSSLLMGLYLRENSVKSCHLHHPVVLLPRACRRVNNCHRQWTWS